MTYPLAILLGAVQGVAEFLPISSSGHLALLQHFFAIENFEETQLFFSVMLHFGTLISVCIYYWNDVVDMIREFFLGIADLCQGRSAVKGKHLPPGRRLVFLVIVATLPLFAILPVKAYIEAATGQPMFVAIALLVTGFLLYFSDRLAKGRKSIGSATVLDVLIVGISQGLGTLPGISRSGITISTGMLRGFDRSFAVRFSFLMSLPAVFGATLLELIDALQMGLDTSVLPYCAVGIVVAAVVGYFAIRLVNILANKGKFGAFAYYCWAAGAIAIVAILLT